MAFLNNKERFSQKYVFTLQIIFLFFRFVSLNNFYSTLRFPGVRIVRTLVSRLSV